MSYNHDVSQDVPNNHAAFVTCVFHWRETVPGGLGLDNIQEKEVSSSLYLSK